MLTLSLLPLFGSNAVGYARSSVLVNQLVERYVDGLARLQADHIEARLEQSLLYLEAVGSGNPVLEVAAEDGRPIFAGEGAGEYLAQVLEDAGTFDALTLFALSGDLVASTHRNGPVGQWPEEGFSRLALVHGQSAEAAPTVRMMAPVTDQPGQVVAYLVATIPLNGGQDFLEIPEHIAGAVESFILDEAGRPIFVSHTHGHVEYDQPFASPLVGAPAGSQARYRDREDVEVVGASAHFPTYPWVFVTEVPVEDALSGLRSLRTLSLALGTLFAALVATAAWLVAGGIVAPVQRLVEATRALGGGDRSARVPADGTDEIGELGRAFNEMAAELAESEARIERLHQQELQRAEQLATVGELASGLAHEIKNPVVGISNGLDLVLRKVHDPGLEPITAEMQRQLRRIEAAVRDLLSFARPPEPTFAPLDVNQVVARACTLVEAAGSKRGVAVEQTLAPDLPQVHADGELLHQAVVNLLMNAVGFSPDGGHVEVGTRTHDPHEIMIDVRDHGPGMDEQVQHQIFKPFYTTRHSGSGLGLSITLGVVERHGGRIDVASGPGQGSTFTIVLPTGRPDEIDP